MNAIASPFGEEPGINHVKRLIQARRAAMLGAQFNMERRMLSNADSRCDPIRLKVVQFWRQKER